MGKIMYNGQEFGGATKLEPGTILYTSKTPEKGLESVHLLSTTKNWSNINGINVKIHDGRNFKIIYADLNITGDDFKSLDTEKEYAMDDQTIVTVSRSIVDGEYRLNISADNYIYTFKIGAL
ncbi:hypothetical protein [Companilactobacillus futsaii]|uniref:Uncharacterized protein n=2 Tax=Companilactobacillus futsaii TaxID=938155 RepID=A0A5B7T1J6_9LACO|nr:hypothetical protein [Companilactobacillus futsaii]QCX24384.1 hypothetical protein FG051_04400 [Companilactobacillus futsaii]